MPLCVALQFYQKIKNNEMIVHPIEDISIHTDSSFIKLDCSVTMIGKPNKKGKALAIDILSFMLLLIFSPLSYFAIIVLLTVLTAIDLCKGTSRIIELKCNKL